MFRVLTLALLISSCSPEFVKVLEGRDQTVGMKAYKDCKEAPRYLIFPKPYPIFTMKGVGFPVRIIGFKDGRVTYNQVHAPEEEIIKLPEVDLVIEVPVCKGEPSPPPD